MKININRYKRLEDVPTLTLEWARVLGGNNIDVEQVSELIAEYEDWLDITEHCDIEPPSPTTEQ